MGNITYQDITMIVDGVATFIVENKKSTKSLYVDIVKEYLLNEVRKQVDQDDYDGIYYEDKIIALC